MKEYERLEPNFYKRQYQLLGLATVLLMLFTPSASFAQATKKVPVSVSHEGTDEVGRSVAHGLEEAIRNSQRFSLVAENAPRPRIIVLLESTEALKFPQLGRVSAIGISIMYYRKGVPGVGVLLGVAVNSCGPNIIKSCANSIITDLNGAVDFLRRHDPDLWETL